MPMKRKSDVWNYFNKCNKDEAECIICQKVLKCAGGCTSTLAYHLRSVHKGMTVEANVECKKSKDRKIEEDVAKLACKDGISFNAIARSEFIQESFKKFNYASYPPKSNAVLDIL